MLACSRCAGRTKVFNECDDDCDCECHEDAADELYDADELGLDPEDDDARQYRTGA